MGKDVDGDTYISTKTNSDEDKLRFYTDSNERMIIDNIGNIGINTDAPTNMLDIYRELV